MIILKDLKKAVLFTSKPISITLADILFAEYSIRPKYGLVEWGGGADASRPLFGEWKSVDINRMLDAEDGLKIAEENGGKDVRIKFDNNCSILLDLVPETYEVWDIEYLDNGLPQFGITIHPFAGNILNRWWDSEN